MRRMLLGTTAGLLVGMLAAVPVRAQCPQDVDRLDQQIATLQNAQTEGARASEAELQELRSMHDAARQLAGAGSVEACGNVVRRAMALVQNIHSPQIVRASTFIGRKMANPQGQELGKLADLIFDPVTGRIVYAVLERGGFLGFDQELFAVPWTLVQQTLDGNDLAIALAREKLDAAPRLDDANWPAMADRQWALAVHTYYGVEPYWVTRGPVAVAAPTGGPETVQRLSQEVETLRQQVRELTQHIEQAGTAPEPTAPTVAETPPPVPPDAQSGSTFPPPAGGESEPQPLPAAPVQ